jgi:ubiquinone/menaquinone biosynthesis C-methylase UbiE
MNKKFEQYARIQKKFWDRPTEKEARFECVDLVSQGSEAHYQQLAERTIRIVLEVASPKADWTLLEIGCGVGRLINQMQQHAQFRKFYGVDISEKMIEYCRKNVGGDPRVTLYVNSGYDLSMVPDASVDFAYSIDVFIHIFDVDVVLNYLREVRRVLKLGALFLFNVREFDPEKSFAESLGGTIAKFSYKLGLKSMGRHRWTPDEPAGFNGNQYTEAEIRQLITEAGLTVHSTKVLENGHIWCTARKDM